MLLKIDLIVCGTKSSKRKALEMLLKTDLIVCGTKSSKRKPFYTQLMYRCLIPNQRASTKPESSGEDHRAPTKPENSGEDHRAVSHGLSTIKSMCDGDVVREQIDV
ncbi:hypothetical protein L6452_01519 [Arctium lappa]|uniref:Uncharacterized protein n=1 Tax=Arctium lappa TaxID=4217 RepID=A0ACB9FHX0_ARCLA|nr:hypothetical protein L6452_01519 [Arctium lappa]